MYKVARFALGALALAFAGGQARAELVNLHDPQEIVEIVQARGWPATLTVPDDGGPYIESRYNGIKFAVFFLNCNDEHKECKTLQYYMGFTDAKDTTLEELNEWNKTKRFGRAYRDDEGDPVLEMDVDVDFDGLPRENIGETLNTWSWLMDAYYEHLFK